MSNRGFSFDKYLTIILFVGLLGVYASIIFERAKRSFVEFREERIPDCFEKIPVIIFSNYYDKYCTNLSICRRLGKIILKDCGENLRIVLESDCGEYYTMDLEENDSVSVEERDGIMIYFIEFSSNLTDCDYFYLNCSRTFFVKISQSNLSVSVGNFTPKYCKGKSLKEYYILKDGTLVLVREK